MRRAKVVMTRTFRELESNAQEPSEENLQAASDLG